MSDFRSLLRLEGRDTLIFTGSNLVNRVGGFLLLPLYWTRLTPTDYGVLAVIGMIGAFQGLLSSLSLDLAVTRLFYEWPESERRINLGAIWVWNWIISVITGVIFLVIFPVFGPLIFPDVAYYPWLLLGIIANLLSNLFVMPATAIRIQRLPLLFASYNLVSFLLSSGLGLWLVLVRNEGLVGYIKATIATNLIMAIVGGALMLRFARPALRSPGLRAAFRFALPATPSNLLGTSGAILDRFLLSSFASLHTLGVYAVCLRFTDVISALHSSLKMGFGPFMMRQVSSDKERGAETVAAMTPFYLLPYFAAAVALSLFIGPLVHLINQPAYFSVVKWVPWLAGIQLLTCMYFYYANGMVLANRTGMLTIPAIAQVVVMLVVGLILIRPYQLAGVVISRYVTTAAFFALSVYLSQKVFPMRHRWRVLLALTALALASVTASQLVPDTRPMPALAIRLMLFAFFLAASWWVLSRGPHMSIRVPLAKES